MKEKIKFGKLEWLVLGTSIILILFSFVAPYLFTMESSTFDFSETGSIGDTIGGIMNPFIAIAGILLTFLAFYIQVKANKQQRDLFRQELDSNKFENQFYEMLRLHKENVNEINLSLSNTFYVGKQSYILNEKVSGRETFKYFLEEIKIIYFVSKRNLPEDLPYTLMNIAYNIFYHGTQYYHTVQGAAIDHKFSLGVFEDLQFLINVNKKCRRDGDENNFRHYVSEKSDYTSAEFLNYDIFQGHSAQLAHYFRHLYQTVKFIVNQDEEFLSYSNKRNYLRILRSQLSNQEQALLFYNWKSKFGNSWENKKNKFFTDYRMIHNLYDDILIEDFKLDNEFNLLGGYKKEKDRGDDFLFEFQNW